MSESTTPSPPAFAILADAAVSACSGAPARIALDAQGGDGGYTWQIVAAPSGWELDATSGNHVNLFNDSPAVGDADISVLSSDATGHQVHRTLMVKVHETPEVTTASLPSACASQPYSFQFAASGGLTTAYRWSVASSTGGDARFDADLLTITPGAAGEQRIGVRVEDDFCPSPETFFDVPITQDITACPTILAPMLPSPCAGEPYPTTDAFGADTGTGPFTWTAIAVPPGLSFDPDPDVLTLSGRAEASGLLTLQLEDGAHRLVRATYPMTVRRHCWLGYVSTQNGATDLRRFDPMLLVQKDISRSAPGEPGVQDFEFSPDGNYLVFTSLASTGVRSMTFVDATTWTTYPIGLPGTVLRYAWSADSTTLAVATEQGQQTFLTDIRMTASTLGEDGGAAPFQTLHSTELLADGAPFDSELQWVGSESVVFRARGQHGASRTPALVAYYAASGASGFAPPVELDQPAYPTAVNFAEGESGFFAIAASPARLDFFRFGSQVLVYALPPGVADPAGRYAASVNAGTLRLFQTVGPVPSASDAPPWVTMSNCTSLLAWAIGRERIACEGAPPGGASGSAASIYMVDLDERTPVLDSGVLRGTTQYQSAMAFERRRLFSPSGNWFALTTDSNLYLANVADTKGGSPHVANSYEIAPPEPTSPYTELLFSPDERFLFIQRGNLLSVQQLDHPEFRPFVVSPEVPELSVPCTETFSDGPSTWCGRAVGSASLRWSPDSLVAAGRTGDGRILTWNFTTISVEDASLDEEEACSEGCAEGFDFQP